MANPEIPLSVRPVDTATPVYKAQAASNENAMATQNVLQQYYANLDSREKSRINSSVVGAVQLKQFLDQGDLPGAQSFLEQRRAALHKRIASGENVDTQETDYALDALRSGKIQELRNGVDGLIAAGGVYGILNQSKNPYVEQFQEVKRAHPEWTDAQVQDYVYTRGQVGKGTVFDASGNVVNPKGAVAAAAEKEGATKFAAGQGGAAGKQIVANDTTLGNLSNLKQAVDAARQQLQKVSMTGPVFGRVGNAARDVEYVNLQRNINEITLLAKDLYNLGSGQGFTDADRDFLQELAGGKYNRADSITYALNRFDSTLANRAAFLQKQSTGYQNQFGAGNSASTTSAPASSQKIKVSNGKETFMIDPADLSAAQQDGYEQE